MKDPEHYLHKARWNKEFRNYLNSAPKEIESILNLKDFKTGNPKVHIKFKHLHFSVDFTGYYCDRCNEAIAWRDGYHGKEKKRCETCRKEAVKINSRKSSKTYREKNKIQINLEISCQQCNQIFKPVRSTKLYCSSNCRMKAFRAKKI